MTLPGRSDPPLAPDEMRAAVDYAIGSRRSVRGFLDKPVDPPIVREILSTAGRAPSGSNIQPWKVHVLTGDALASLSEKLTEAFDRGEPEQQEYYYYPRVWREPYLTRRRATGWGLYELAGIKRGDREAGHAQRAKNYRFFEAPVGMVFTIDSELEQGSWLDYGMFLQSIMIGARGNGLDTCPQAAIANYPDIVKAALGIPADEVVVCGMALGHADPAEPTNSLATSRCSVEDIVHFHSTE